MVQLPLPSAVPVPIRMEPPRNTCTVLLASAVPVKVGVVTLVMLSVLELPLSLAAVRSGAEGAAGALVSIVMLRAPEAPDTLPAASVALAVILCVPVVRAVLRVIPAALAYAAAVPLPTWTPSLKSVTVLPVSAVPVKAGVVLLVMLSVLELPVSVAAVISGVAGAAAVVSMVMLRPPEAADTFPAASVALAVMLYVPSASALLVMLQ